MNVNQDICNQNVIAAYVDSELDYNESILFEKHLEMCEECRTELTAHRLFMCELDSAMTHNADLPVPDNFSRLVAVRAISDMRGVRSKSEHKKAALFSIALALVAFTLLGTTASRSTLGLGRKLVGKIFGLAEFVWTTSYDTVASLTIVSRVLSRKFIVDSGSLGLLLALLAVAVVLLSRLISNYHRTGAIE